VGQLHQHFTVGVVECGLLALAFQLELTERMQSLGADVLVLEEEGVAEVDEPPVLLDVEVFGELLPG